MDLTIINYNELPGLATLKTIGVGILSLAFCAAIGRNIAKARQGQGADWQDPFLRFGGGALLLIYLPHIGQWLVGIVQPTSTAMGSEAKLQLFGRAISVALGNTTCDASWFGATIALLFTPQGWLAMGSSVVYLLMFLLKFLVIDILWVCLFALIVCSGVLAVPIGVFPGMDTLKGWFRNLIEISLWPVIFQMLVAILAIGFPQVIADMAGGHVTIGCSASQGTTAVLGDTVNDTEVTQAVRAIQFLAICAGYIVMTIFTPFLSAIICRGAPAGIIGGIMAAKAMSAIQGGVKAAAGAITGGAGGATGAIGGSGGGLGGGAGSVYASAGAALPSAQQGMLDQRQPGGWLQAQVQPRALLEAPKK